MNTFAVPLRATIQLRHQQISPNTVDMNAFNLPVHEELVHDENLSCLDDDMDQSQHPAISSDSSDADDDEDIEERQMIEDDYHSCYSL